MSRVLASLLGAALLAIVAYDGVVVGRALVTGGQVARESRAFSQHPPSPTATLLVVGDSTGVGTGADDPGESIAGRLGGDLPRTHIDNLAVNGALTAEVLAQLERAPRSRYDAILVQVGGNDALRLTSLGALEDDIDAVLAAAGAKARYVALMSTGDLGNAPAIPWPIDAFYSRRSRAVRDRFAAAAADHGADYVDLFANAGDNPIARRPDIYHARDGLHLSGAGYGIWYDRLRADTALPGCLAGGETTCDEESP